MTKDIFLNGKPYIDLDISAQLYSYTKTKTWNQTIRISAEMTEKVDPKLLYDALMLIKPRFPSFFVKFYEDFFWKRFQAVSDEECQNVVEKEKEICRPIDTENDSRPLFRVLYSGSRISFETFHGVTDGRGAIVFLKNLIAAYLTLSGIEIPKENEILDWNESPKAEELEDTFIKNYDPKGKRLSRSGKAVYQYKPESEDGKLHAVQGRFFVDEIKALSKEQGATITEYLTAVYIYSFYKNLDSPRKSKPITIEVPMDIRRFYNSVSLRNSSLYANITIEPAKFEYTFEDILKQTKKQFKEGIEPTIIQENVNVNVHDSVMPLARYSPSFLKKPFIKLAFILYGERLFTSPLSNLGVVQVPQEMENHIKYIYAVIGKTYKNRIYATVSSFKSTMLVTFSSTGTENPIAQTYFSFLEDKGINLIKETL